MFYFHIINCHTHTLAVVTLHFTAKAKSVLLFFSPPKMEYTLSPLADLDDSLNNNNNYVHHNYQQQQEEEQQNDYTTSSSISLEKKNNKSMLKNNKI